MSSDDPEAEEPTPFERAKLRFSRNRRGAPPSPPPEARPRTLLVLDADPRGRAGLDSALNAAGYRVVSTPDADAALQSIRKDPPDFVLVDLAMGAMDAVPRWQRRRSDPEPTASVPVSDGHAVLRALEMGPSLPLHMVVFLRTRLAADGPTQRFGVVDYIAKPLDPQVLRERIEHLYDQLEPHLPAPATEPGRAAASPRPPSPPVPALAEAEALPGTVPWGEAERRLAASQVVPGLTALPQGLRTVLLADGDAASRQALAELLTPHGFTIHEAVDGEEALRIALARRPWMILTEVNLPGIDGFEFCRRVRGHSLLRYTPLIFVSSWDDYAERELGLRLGADEYFSKQTPVRELLIRLQLIFMRYLRIGTRTHHGSGMAGTIELIGAIGMLQICHLGRLTGVCTVRGGSDAAQIRFREGEIVFARCDRSENAAAAAIYEFLSWDRGQFDFVPGPPGDEPPLKESFDFLLLEGCRRLDDSQRGASAEEVS